MQDINIILNIHLVIVFKISVWRPFIITVNFFSPLDKFLYSTLSQSKITSFHNFYSSVFVNHPILDVIQSEILKTTFSKQIPCLKYFI